METAQFACGDKWQDKWQASAPRIRLRAFSPQRAPLLRILSMAFADCPQGTHGTLFALPPIAGLTSFARACPMFFCATPRGRSQNMP